MQRKYYRAKKKDSLWIKKRMAAQRAQRAVQNEILRCRDARMRRRSNDACGSNKPTPRAYRYQSRYQRVRVFNTIRRPIITGSRAFHADMRARGANVSTNAFRSLQDLTSGREISRRREMRIQSMLSALPTLQSTKRSMRMQSNRGSKRLV